MTHLTPLYQHASNTTTSLLRNVVDQSCPFTLFFELNQAFDAMRSKVVQELEDREGAVKQREDAATALTAALQVTIRSILHLFTVSAPPQ